MKTIEEMVAEATRRGITYGKLQQELYAERCARHRQREQKAAGRYGYRKLDETVRGHKLA